MKQFVSDFTVLYKDLPVAEVLISGTDIKIKKYVSDSCIQPFGGERQDMARVYEFLESRCYENGRMDLEEILAQVGMSWNNPWEWVYLTHGVTWEDYLWIRFPGEDLQWEDVRIR